MKPLVAALGLIGAGLYFANSGKLFGAQVNEGDVLERGKYLQAQISIRNDGQVTERVQVRATTTFPDLSSNMVAMYYFDPEDNKWYSGPTVRDIQPGQTITISFRSAEPMPQFVPGASRVATQVRVDWKVLVARTQQEYTGSASFRLAAAGAPNITVAPVVFSQ